MLRTSVDFMVKNVDSRQNTLDRLRALRAEKPITQMGQIRESAVTGTDPLANLRK
jgi:hypothetical protein